MSTFQHRVEIKGKTIVITFTMSKDANKLLPNWPAYLNEHIKYARIDRTRTKATVENYSRIENRQASEIIRHIVKAVKNVNNQSKKEHNKIDNEKCMDLKLGFIIGIIIYFIWVNIKLYSIHST